MRRPLLACCLAACVATLVGCGGAEPERTPYAESLGTLCDATRAELEAVGESREIGFEEWARGQVEVGQGFVAELDRLQPSALERARARRLRDSFDLYFRGTSYSLGLYRAGEEVGFRVNQQRANDVLAQAEKLAVLLGAPECAQRPFA
jgi:hypothetical protein